jgi:hypothetical protein
MYWSNLIHTHYVANDGKIAYARDTRLAFV